MAITAAYRFNPDAQEWNAIILDDDQTVLTVGVEFTEQDIQTWCKATLKSWPITGREAPDAYDRRS